MFIHYRTTNETNYKLRKLCVLSSTKSEKSVEQTNVGINDYILLILLCISSYLRSVTTGLRKLQLNISCSFYTYKNNYIYVNTFCITFFRSFCSSNIFFYLCIFLSSIFALLRICPNRLNQFSLVWRNFQKYLYATSYKFILFFTLHLVFTYLLTLLFIIFVFTTQLFNQVATVSKW